MKLKFDIKNCYGIGDLNYEIDYNASNIAVVYAPNGTMKTSLTKTISQLLAGKEPCDDFYPMRVSSASVTIDGMPIDGNNTYVFKNEDADGSKQISTFLVNTELKEEYDTIYNQLNSAKKALNKKIKQYAKSSDCEEEILEAFKTSDEDNYFDCLLLIEKQLAEGKERLEYDFKFNAVFEKKDTRVKNFIHENQETIQQYFEKYHELLKGSRLFRSGEESFGTTHVNSLLKSVSDNRYFLAGHKFELGGSDGEEPISISSKDEMESTVNAEIQRILADEGIRQVFTELDDKLQKHEKLKDFKEVIQANPELIPELLDYDGFQKKILRGYLSRSSAELHSLTELYLAHKDKLKEIVRQANEERSQWERVIGVFRDRFFVPFSLELKNKSDILLSAKAPELQFLYQDGGEAPIKQESKILIDHLSTGEKKAFFILQNLFELEARRAKGQQTLLVFDDVADSFDYKNKYAIVEYLYDLKQESCFKILVLTHNFDFYRTVVTRLEPGHNIFFANRKGDRSVEMDQGFFKPDILKKRLLERLTERKAFIACIPFVRNIIEYKEGERSVNYNNLTSCLHLKSNTSGIDFNSIKLIFDGGVKVSQDTSISFGADNYLTALREEGEAVLSDQDEVDIVNKLVLSMAIRFKAEEYMQSVLTSEQLTDLRPNRNQTAELLNILKKYHWNDKERECLLMNKVLMLTSENIHINNFMFEPLVDISILHLKQLYNEVKSLLVAEGV